MRDSQFSGYDNVTTPVFVIAPDADAVPRVLYVNRAGLGLTGLAPDRIAGATALDLFPGRFGRNTYARHAAALATGAATTLEVEMPSPTGSRWFRTSCIPVHAAPGRPRHMVWTLIETTSQHLADEIVMQMQATHAEMEQFVALAAHDLRAPMRHVRFIAEILREDFVDMGDGKIDLIDQLEEIAAKSAELIADVLKHAQVGGLQPESQTFSLGELCDNIAGVLDPRGEHQMTWPDCDLQADKTALQLILRNLMDNAIKHGGREALQIAIALVEQPDRLGMIEFRLSDTGCGFKYPKEVFAEDGKCRTHAGFGLLGIKKLIRARQGTIWVETARDGEGGVVGFRIPGKVLRRAAPPKAWLPERRAVAARQ